MGKQGWRDAIVVGIEVSKDKFEIALLPQGETFTTSQDAKVLASRFSERRLEEAFPGILNARYERIREAGVIASHSSPLRWIGKGGAKCSP